VEDGSQPCRIGAANGVRQDGAARAPIMGARTAISFSFFNHGAHIMSKSQDSKKATKKEPAKTPKEKKEAKKVKKEAMKRQ
jgi:hypothetical protein